MPGSARFDTAIDDLQDIRAHSTRVMRGDITLRERVTARSIGTAPKAGQTCLTASAVEQILTRCGRARRAPDTSGRPPRCRTHRRTRPYCAAVAWRELPVE